MSGYLMSFTFYTLAMIGVILIGYVIAKKSLNGVYSQTSKNKFLSIESVLTIEPRKNIYLLKAGSERFLISANADQTQFLTKLDSENVPSFENNEIECASPLFNNLLSKNNVVTNIVEKFVALFSAQTLKR